MADSNDWYPSTLEGEREMYQAIDVNFDDVNATLKADATVSARIKEIAQTFLAYDENLTLNKSAVEALSKGFQTIRTGKKGVDPMPVAPKYHSLTLPAGDFVGMEKEVRDIRRYLTGLFTWTENMGDILKMNGKESTGRNEDELSPDVKITQIEGVKVYATAKKDGMDGFEYQWRVAGAPLWQPLTNSGDADTILEIPIEAGAAQKIELRAIYLKKFKRVGKWSPTYNAAVGG